MTGFATPSFNPAKCVAPMLCAAEGFGGEEPAAAELLLDTYPNAAAAYSLRKLRSDYMGAAVRIRRSSDNTEQDIGFDSNGDFDAASAESFCGAGDGFVATWYDQSGNSLDASSSILADQPKIVSSGAVITSSGKAGVQFVSYVYLETSDTAIATQPNTVFVCGQADGDSRSLFMDGKTARQYAGRWNNGWIFDAGTDVQDGTPDTNAHIFDILFDGADSDEFVDGSLSNSGDPGSNDLTGLYVGNSSSKAGNNWDLLSELIIYDDALGSDRSDVRDNVNAYYSVF